MIFAPLRTDLYMLAEMYRYSGFRKSAIPLGLSVGSNAGQTYAHLPNVGKFIRIGRPGGFNTLSTCGRDPSNTQQRQFTVSHGNDETIKKMARWEWRGGGGATSISD